MFIDILGHLINFKSIECILVNPGILKITFLSGKCLVLGTDKNLLKEYDFALLVDNETLDTIEKNLRNKSLKVN